MARRGGRGRGPARRRAREATARSRAARVRRATARRRTARRSTRRVARRALEPSRRRRGSAARCPAVCPASSLPRPAAMGTLAAVLGNDPPSVIAAASPEAGARPYAILVVDDEVGDRSSRSTSRSRDDYTVFTATSGEEGLGDPRARGHRPRDRGRVDARRCAARSSWSAPSAVRPERGPHADHRSDGSRVGGPRDQRGAHLSVHPEAVGHRRPAAQREARARDVSARARERAARRGALRGQREAARREPVSAPRGAAAVRLRPDPRLEPARCSACSR